jgi:type IV secretory pathway VirB2 component (pilin)
MTTMRTMTKVAETGRLVRVGWAAAWLTLCVLAAMEPAWAQTSPFSTGATSLQTNFLAIFTPIAVVAVMGIAIAFWFNRISAAWAAGLVVGIVLFFGAPQMVTWVRSMFAV